MIIDILYNFYTYVNDIMSGTIIELFCLEDLNASKFSDAELDDIFTYIYNTCSTYNLEYHVDKLGCDHIVLVHSDSVYMSMYKVRDNLYITKASYERKYNCARTMSELYDSVIQLIISIKLNKI